MEFERLVWPTPPFGYYFGTDMRTWKTLTFDGGMSVDTRTLEPRIRFRTIKMLRKYEYLASGLRVLKHCSLEFKINSMSNDIHLRSHVRGENKIVSNAVLITG